MVERGRDRGATPAVGAPIQRFTRNAGHTHNGGDGQRAVKFPSFAFYGMPRPRPRVEVESVPSSPASERDQFEAGAVATPLPFLGWIRGDCAVFGDGRESAANAREIPINAIELW